MKYRTLLLFSQHIISLIERERLQQSTITNGNIRESGSCNSLSQQRWNDITMVKYNKTTLENEEWTTTIHQMEYWHKSTKTSKKTKRTVTYNTRQQQQHGRRDENQLQQNHQMYEMIRTVTYNNNNNNNNMEDETENQLQQNHQM